MSDHGGPLATAGDAFSYIVGKFLTYLIVVIQVLRRENDMRELAFAVEHPNFENS